MIHGPNTKSPPLELKNSQSNQRGVLHSSWVFTRSCILLGSIPAGHTPVLTVEGSNLAANHLTRYFCLIKCDEQMREAKEPWVCLETLEVVGGIGACTFILALWVNGNSAPALTTWPLLFNCP